MESINWSSFKIARKHHSQHSKQIVKMFHEETRDHLILCTTSEPRKWRTEVLSEIQKVLPRLHTAPELCE
eukprot:5869426-Ditylum_brightwellii.AAC.1